MNKDAQIKQLERENQVFQKEIKILQLKIIELEKVIVKQGEKNEELERRLGLNSSNSGKPPSSDGFKKPIYNKSLRENGKRKSGGQHGHQGSTLNQVENPDVIEVHKVYQCPNCQTDLTNNPTDNVIKKQIFDIPKIKPHVIEHQLEVKCCPGCKKKVIAEEVIGAKAPVQYGKRAKTTAAYLNVQNLIPEKRTSEIMSDLFGLSMSIATVEKVTKTLANKVDSIVGNIKENLKTAPVKGADESGFRVNNKIAWLHTLCSNKFVYYRASEKRGDVPTDLKGIVVHDHFQSYFSKMKGVAHAMCNAHHLRELKAISEIDKEPWAKHLSRLLLAGKNKVEETTKDCQSVPVQWLKKFQKLYDRIISEAISYHEKLGVLRKPKRGRVKRRPGHNLLLRLQSRRPEVLRFLENPNVPFTNNQAEQSLRMLKVKHKVSGCFRTMDGANAFFAARSYTATAQKQTLNIIDAISCAFDGKLFLLT